MKKIFLITFLTLYFLYGHEKITQKTYKELQKAQKLIDSNKFNDASITLNNLLKKQLNNTAKSYALQSLANLNIIQEKYKKAAKYYEQIVKLNALEYKDINKIKFSLSQLYLSEGLYSKSIRYSNELLQLKFNKKNKLYENLALAYYYNGQYKKSIKYIKITLNNQKKKTSWYKMLYSSYVEIKDYNNAVKVMKTLLAKDNSNQDYWMQLISLYQNMKKYKKSLATIELAYKKNIINKSKNLMYFVNILLQNNIYNKAAKMMDEGINKKIITYNQKNFDIMISSYLNAKNYKKVIKKLNSSSYANNNKYKLILGNIYYNNNKYKSAINVLKNFSFSKNSSYDGQRYTLLALSHYELSQEDAARKYLTKASSNKYERKRAFQIAKSLGIKI